MFPKLKKHVLYMRSGRAIVLEGKDIFDACKRGKIADPTADVDFWTEPNMKRFIRQDDRWVEGPNPDVEIALGNFEAVKEEVFQLPAED